MCTLKTGYLELWASEQNLPLARFADCTRSIVSTGLDLLAIEDISPPRRLMERLGAFDSIISWYGSNREEFRSQVSRLDLPFHFLPALPAGPNLHAVDFYLEQVRPWACAPASAIPRIECPCSRGSHLAIHPFASSPRKRWPLSRFEQISGGFPVRWCAAPADSLPGAVKIGNLYELACWLATARVYLGNDSGITHLAAATGVPVVALFGPSDPAVWAPRGDTVRVVARSTMDEITVEEVRSAVLALW